MFTLRLTMFFTDIQNATAKQEAVCKSVISWYARKFLRKYNFDITVEHCNMEDHFATVYVSGELDKPDDFTIEIDSSLSDKEYIMTLIHELIHIEDYIKGNLTERNGERYWKGVMYDRDDYENQPWEIRAELLEEQYYNQYCCTIS